jgi:HSP20 family molecular chaperone IbpA
MESGDQRGWMWTDAVEMLARAERLHRQMFQPQPGNARAARWEPPVDVIETEREVIILAALPGVDPGEIAAAIHDDGLLVISGQRTLPEEFQTAAIHRLELPQGRFERRVPLPAGRYQGAVRTGMNNGCLVVSLTKAP